MKEFPQTSRDTWFDRVQKRLGLKPSGNLFTSNEVAVRRNSSDIGEKYIDEPYLRGLEFYRNDYIDLIKNRPNLIDSRVSLSDKNRIVVPPIKNAHDWLLLATSLPGNFQSAGETRRLNGIFVVSDTGEANNRLGDVVISLDEPQKSNNYWNQGKVKHAFLVEKNDGVRPALYAGEISLEFSLKKNGQFVIKITNLNNNSGGFQTRAYLEKNNALLKKLKETFQDNPGANQSFETSVQVTPRAQLRFLLSNGRSK